jgi:hypothetical protein
MYYTNFDQKITAKYQVVCNGWPLSKFCSPSDLRSRNEVEILYNAWKSDTTYFRRLTDEEWTQWDQARFQDALRLTNGNEDERSDGEDGVGVNLPIPGTSSLSETSVTFGAITPQHLETVPNPSGSRKRKAAPLTDSVAVNTLTSISGDSIGVTKKPRKQRSDAGKKRGPRKVAQGSTSSSGPS